MPTDLSPATLRPLPIRVTQRQYERLRERRSLDQLSIQEHIRRALDAYLDRLDRGRYAGDPRGAEAQAAVASEEPEAVAPPHAPTPPSPVSGRHKQRSKMVMR